MTANRSLRQGGLIWLLLSVFVIGLDQLTKFIVIRSLDELVPHQVIPGFLNWTLAFNSGAAFSFLADQQGWQRWLFSGLAIAVTGMIAFGIFAPRHAGAYVPAHIENGKLVPGRMQ